MTVAANRLLTGLLAAYGVTVGVAFVSGCAYASMLGKVHGGSAQATDSLPLGAILSIGGVIAVTAALFAAVATLVFALPLFAFMLRWKLSSAIAYLGAGVLLAIATGAVVALLHYFAGFLIDPDFRFGLVAIAISGPIAGVMFWIAAVRGIARSGQAGSAAP